MLVATVGSACVAANRLVRRPDFVDRLNTVTVRDDAAREVLGRSAAVSGAGTVLRALEVGKVRASP